MSIPLNNTPSYAHVTQTTMFPKKDQAIVIDAIENVQIKEYAQALGKIIEPSQIRFLSRISNNRICIYVSTKAIADDIVDNKKSITVQNQKLPIRSLINRNKRIILSNVCPIIPHTEIEKKLQEIQIKPMSPISFLRAGLNETGFNHILSFRRQMFVTPEDFVRLPEKIAIEYDDTTYWIYISSDTMTCFLCKDEGHLASKCPVRDANTNCAEIQEDNDKQDNSIFQPVKRPHPPTESSISSATPTPNIPTSRMSDEIYSEDDIDISSQSSSEDEDEPASSGDSGDESGSEPESPSEKLMQVHKQEWLQNENNDRENIKREAHSEPQASTSSTTQEADSSKPTQSLQKILPKPMDLPGGAMLYHSGVLAGVGLDGLGSNIGLGNLAMGYPHSFILGLANQGQDGASSSSQPQFITIPLSMAMAAAAGAPSATATNGCPSASSDDSSELQDLSTGRK